MAAGGASRYDVAVVGLGAMGSAALFNLARRGVRAVGIERFEPGHDRGSSHGDSRAIRLGYSEHPSYVPLAHAAYASWRELERLTGETVLTVTGVLEIGRPGSAMVEGSLTASRLHDLEHEHLDAAGIRRRFPQFDLPADYSAVWQPDGGFVRPDIGNALHLRLAAAAGADIRARCKVLDVETGDGAIRIAMEGGRIEADRVILAAGPWIGEFVPALRPKLTIARQVLGWIRPDDAAPFALGRLPVFMVESPEDTIFGFPQFSPVGMKLGSHFDSGLLDSADAARQDAGPADEARLRRFLDRFMPGASGPVSPMKTCIYTRTPDEDFVIDLLPDDPRIVVASPCSGHGYKFAGVIGEILADLATDGATRHDISRFTMGRFSSSR